MTAYINIRLFATLSLFTPESSEAYPIAPGIVIRELLVQLGVSEDQAKLIFVNHLKADLNTVLYGGERVGIFPPIGGG